MRSYYVKIYAYFVAILLLFTLITPFMGVVDDAWITYAYARNLAEGHGIAYNPGERVEGCTAFLHMVILAPFSWLTRRLDIVATVLNILAWAAVASLAWSFIRRRDGGQVGVLGLFAASFITLGMSGLAWAYAGMEMPLVALAWLGAAKVHLLERERNRWPWISALIVVVAGLLRPDGILVAVPLALSIWIEKPKQYNWGKAIVFSAIVLTLFGGYWLWRWHYFGYPLPNTFYAKVTRTSVSLSMTGARYVLRWIFGMVVPLLVIVAMIYARGRRAVPRWVRLMSGLVLTSMAYCLLVGSDFFSYHRFLLPSYAAMVLVGWWYGVGALTRYRQRFGAGVSTRKSKIVKVMLLLVCLNVVYFVSPSKPANAPNSASRGCISLFYPPQGLVHAFIVRNTRDWAEVAQKLDHLTPAEATIATIPIGAMGYYTHRRVIDMVGLTDVHIAHTEVPTGEAITGHEKYDIDYVLARRPSLIYTWPGLMPAGEEGLLKWVVSNIGAEAQKQLMTDRRTRIEYSFCRLPMKDDQWVIGLIRSELMGRPEYQAFQPLTKKHAEWIWYAFTSTTMDELRVKVMELKKGVFTGEISEGSMLDQGVALPFAGGGSGNK